MVFLSNVSLAYEKVRQINPHPRTLTAPGAVTSLTSGASLTSAPGAVTSLCSS